MSQPIRRTLVETYLRNRGIKAVHDAGALQFHPRCYYRPDDSSPTETWPAMIAAVTDLSGDITGVHRTWLAPDGFGKAPVDTPRRAMGGLLGHAVRFGAADDVLAVGEGIETMLSLRCALPGMPMASALSANHLAVLLLPLTLRRLYVAVARKQTSLANTLEVGVALFPDPCRTTRNGSTLPLSLELLQSRAPCESQQHTHSEVARDFCDRCAHRCTTLRFTMTEGPSCRKKLWEVSIAATS
jgi:Toprim domain